MIILSTWILVFIFMIFVWMYYRLSNNPGIIDVAWSLGHLIAGMVLLFSATINQRTIVIFLALSIWAFRLAGYLYYTRVRVGHVDKRYMKLSQQWQISPALGFFFNFQLQGVLLMLTVSCLYLSSRTANNLLNPLDLTGLALVLLGVTGETIADLQLRNFIKKYPGRVCDIGLWQYSRHPNYFFEWLVWVGFSLTAISAPHGWLAIISPLTLYLIMTQVTGPMTEKGSVESKGDHYREYQTKTSYFFPYFRTQKSAIKK